MANKVINTILQARIDTTTNWTTNSSFVLMMGEVGIERKSLGGAPETFSHLIKIGDGVSTWAQLDYAWTHAADVYAWAKAADVVEAPLTSYVKAASTGAITSADTLKIALSRLENNISSSSHARKHAITSTNDHSAGNWKTFYSDGSGNLVELALGASGKVLKSNGASSAPSWQDDIDTGATVVTVSGSGNAVTTATYDSGTRTITLTKGTTFLTAHPSITMGSDTTPTESLSHGGTFQAISGVTKDANGHVTAVATKTFTLPTDNNTVTRLKTDSTAANVTVSSTLASGDIVLGDAASKVVSTSIPASPTTDQQASLPNLSAVKAYVDALLASNDAMVFKGTLGTGGTITALPASHGAGNTYRVITAGTYAGVACEIGDLVICITDGTVSNNAHWTVVQTNIDGAVVGPASAVSGRIATFSGTTGKIIQDSGFTIATSVPSGAVFTDTVYTHPTHTSYTSGLYKVTVNTLGHVTGATAVVKADITDLGIPAQDTVYSHPTGDGNLHVIATSTTNNGKFLKAGATAGSLSWGTPTNTTYTVPASSTGTGTSLVAKFTLTGSDASEDEIKFAAANGVKLSLATDTITVGIDSISTDLLTQGTNTLVLYGGTSSGW